MKLFVIFDNQEPPLSHGGHGVSVYSLARQAASMSGEPQLHTSGVVSPAQCPASRRDL